MLMARVGRHTSAWGGGGLCLWPPVRWQEQHAGWPVPTGSRLVQHLPCYLFPRQASEPIEQMRTSSPWGQSTGLSPQAT